MNKKLAHMGFNIFELNGGDYYFTITVSDGKDICTSAHFSTLEDCKGAIEIIKMNAKKAAVHYSFSI